MSTTNKPEISYLDLQNNSKENTSSGKEILVKESDDFLNLSLERLVRTAKSSAVDMMSQDEDKENERPNQLISIIQEFVANQQDILIELSSKIPITQLEMAIQRRLLTAGKMFIPIVVPKFDKRNGSDYFASTQLYILEQLRAIFKYYGIEGCDELLADPNKDDISNNEDYSARIEQLLKTAIDLLSFSDNNFLHGNSSKVIIITQDDGRKDSQIYPVCFQHNPNDEGNNRALADDSIIRISIKDDMTATPGINPSELQQYYSTTFGKVYKPSSITFYPTHITNWHERIINDMRPLDSTALRAILLEVEFITHGDFRASIAMLEHMQDIFPQLYRRIMQHLYVDNTGFYSAVDLQDQKLLKQLYERYFEEEIVHINRLLTFLKRDGLSRFISEEPSEDKRLLSRKDICMIYSIAAQFRDESAYPNVFIINQLIAEIIAKAFYYNYYFQTDGQGLDLVHITKITRSILGCALNTEDRYSQTHRDTLLQNLSNFDYSHYSDTFNDLYPVIKILDVYMIEIFSKISPMNQEVGYFHGPDSYEQIFISPFALDWLLFCYNIKMAEKAKPHNNNTSDTTDDSAGESPSETRKTPDRQSITSVNQKALDRLIYTIITRFPPKYEGVSRTFGGRI